MTSSGIAGIRRTLSTTEPAASSEAAHYLGKALPRPSANPPLDVHGEVRPVAFPTAEGGTVVKRLDAGAWPDAMRRVR
jgi:hypothetical protein